MKKYIILLIILFGVSQLFSQINQFGSNDEKVKNNYTFGVRIVPSGYSATQYFTVKTNSDNSIISSSLISKNSFVKQAMGLEESEANPFKENFFVKYEIFDSVKIMRNVIASIYPVPTDKKVYKYKKLTRFNNQIYFFATKDVENLWKLRYAIYPFSGTQDTLGWTRNFKNTYMPKDEQMNILKQYGVKSINYFIYGEDLFKLLKDMFMKEWVLEYIKAGEEDQK